MDPWDPDTDDDGLPDGWERVGSPRYGYLSGGMTLDSDFASTSPTDPDSDEDGVWDGWIGVHGVGYTDNVILYQHNLQDDEGNGAPSGIQGSERVDEQTEVHRIEHENGTELSPAATAVDIDDDGWTEHSTVHVGERHWGSDPDDGGDVPDRSLTVEVDNVVNSSWGGDGAIPAIENDNGVSLDTAVERNYALYGIDVRLVQNENVTQSQLSTIGENICSRCVSSRYSVTPAGLNRWELIRIEDEIHDNESRLHLLWGTTLENDSPATAIDVFVDYDDATGQAWHVGAPDSPDVALIEGDFGVMVARDQFETDEYQELQSVTMHELGHALSIGWADDAPVPGIGEFRAEHAYEVYSGNDDPSLTGGVDETPEYLAIDGSVPRDHDTIMARGYARNARGVSTETPRLVFSIEELSTVDLNHVPSRSE